MSNKYERAKNIEKIIQRDYLDTDVDAADIALGIIEQEPSWSDEEVARHVAQLIEQA